jgi:hypothetical protein
MGLGDFLIENLCVLRVLCGEVLIFGETANLSHAHERIRTSKGLPMRS